MKFIMGIVSMALGFSFYSASVAARVGGVDGGGGVGVRCPGSNQNPASFELLDLQEARLRGTQILHDPHSEDEAIDLIATLFTDLSWNPDTIPKPESKALTVKFLAPFFNGGKWTDPSDAKEYQVRFVSSLPLSNDIGNYRTYPGCQLEQVAYFDDSTSTLSIASNWSELDWLDRAALVSHELAYWGARKDGMEYFGQNIVMTSEKARRFVGDLFSTNGLTPHADSIPQSRFIVCASEDNGDTYGYGFNDANGNLVMIFNVIHDHSSFYQMKASFAGININTLLNRSNGKGAAPTTLQFTDEYDAPEFILKITKTRGSYAAFDLMQQQSGQEVPIAPRQRLRCNNFQN